MEPRRVFLYGAIICLVAVGLCAFTLTADVMPIFKGAIAGFWVCIVLFAFAGSIEAALRPSKK